jgi:hypothetical protein
LKSATKNPHNLSFADLPAPFEAANLRDNVTVLSTIADVRAFNAKHDDDVRVEQVAGRFAVIRHNTTTHVASLAGEALAYAQDRLGAGPRGNATSVGARASGRCVPSICLAVWGCKRSHCLMCFASYCI